MESFDLIHPHPLPATIKTEGWGGGLYPTSSKAPEGRIQDLETAQGSDGSSQPCAGPASHQVHGEPRAVGQQLVGETTQSHQDSSLEENPGWCC